MLKRLKERFLGDERVIGLEAELRSLYEAANDPESFHAALSDGDIDRAAEFHPFTPEDLHDRIDGMIHVGSDLANDYPDVVDAVPDEFEDR